MIGDALMLKNFKKESTRSSSRKKRSSKSMKQTKLGSEGRRKSPAKHLQSRKIFKDKAFKEEKIPIVSKLFLGVRFCFILPKQRRKQRKLMPYTRMVIEHSGKIKRHDRTSRRRDPKKIVEDFGEAIWTVNIFHDGEYEYGKFLKRMTLREKNTLNVSYRWIDKCVARKKFFREKADIDFVVMPFEHSIPLVDF